MQSVASSAERAPLLPLHERDVQFADTPNPRELSKQSYGTAPPPADASEKLGTFEGVFIPTTLNVLSILMFLRFGFIIGQAGFLGTVLLLLISYTINILTTLSVSAIATNGVVRGGGAYYMISRSLGPEFGGSIGVIFYIGQVLNAGLNVVGFCVPLINNFGSKSGAILKVLPESYWWTFTYETILLFFCTFICFVGPSLFARSSKLLFVVLIVATASIPISALLVGPYFSDNFQAWYTGPSWDTFKDNLMPRFTKGAAGSEIKGRENFQDLFGILFPATAGIFAGSSMSGDLKTPSKSIPKGTLNGIWLTIILYLSVVLAISGCASRDLLYQDIEIMRNSNISPILVILGEFATTLFSALMGIIGAAKLLQAISRDNILPFVHVFGKGTITNDNPLLAIFVTYFLTQLTIFLDINKIAIFITMAFLMTFVVTNLACFLLDISSAPNFRPSFRYFNATTAFVGSVLSVITMGIADGWAAMFMVALGLALFCLIHFYSPPKPWGDVSQTLIYHQVRKYLLRLRDDHVKYWRPQILLLVDDPRTSWSLIKFCNHLKKGGLFVLGHVIVTNDFKKVIPEIRAQRIAWTKLRDACNIKAFVQVNASEDIVWGVRNVFLASGLGGMRPNITVLGFYDERPPINSQTNSSEELPTDSCRKESHMGMSAWVNVIEDLLMLRTNVAVAKGFLNLDIPTTTRFHDDGLAGTLGYIDLYPIQMSAQIVDADGRASGMSINFDTYTMILQLGAILHTVPAWHKTQKLRVIAFVEKINQVASERERIAELLEKLRIPAETVVCSLDQNNLAYSVIVRGAPDTTGEIGKALKGSRWWGKLCEARTNPRDIRFHSTLHRRPSAGQSQFISPGKPLARRWTMSELQQMGVSHSMQSTHWRRQDLMSFDTDDDSQDTSDSESDTENERRDSQEQEGSNEEEIPSFTDRPRFDVDRLDSSAAVTGSAIEGTPPPEDGPRSSIVPKAGKLKLNFDELPAKAQHLIINYLMRSYSKDSTVIFTTLPAPSSGTAQSQASAANYIKLLELLTNDLPPTVLIHSQSMTVTTTL